MLAAGVPEVSCLACMPDLFEVWARKGGMSRNITEEAGGAEQVGCPGLALGRFLGSVARLETRRWVPTGGGQLGFLV